MDLMAPVGKWLVMIGLTTVVAGLTIWGLGSLGWFGHLPGDIYYRRGNVTFYFPLATGILLSIVFSLILMLLRR
jgi:hypothetical protein